MNPFDDPTYDEPVLIVYHLPLREGPSLQEVVPAAVRDPAQLPPYLMLGERDDGSFWADAEGWSVRWRGMDPQTWLHWRYERRTDTNHLSHRWLGIDGGIAMYPASVPIGRVLGMLYQPFPKDWDATAQRLHTSHFRLTYVGEGARSVIGIPDGPMRTIVTPVCADRIERLAQHWIHRVQTANLPYPLVSMLMRVRCDAAYVLGCHGIGDADAGTVQARCERQTGQSPASAPERVRVLDDRPAWEVQRHVPCIVTMVPFAGLTAALLMLDDIGVLTPSREPFALRDDQPDGADPLVLPTASASGLQITLWPRDRSMRVRWTLADVVAPMLRACERGELH